MSTPPTPLQEEVEVVEVEEVVEEWIWYQDRCLLIAASKDKDKNQQAPMI